MTPEPIDQFLSEDDLNLRDLSWDELLEQWDAWLRAASATDEEDTHDYSHGVFMRLENPPPGWKPLAPTTSGNKVLPAGHFAAHAAGVKLHTPLPE